MTAVNKYTLYSDTYKNVYYTVSGILAGSLSGIYSTFPDVGGSDFPGYPICTINSANIVRNALTHGSNYITNNKVNVGVTVYSKSMQTIDQLSDKIFSGLSASDKSSTGTYVSGLVKFTVNSSPTNTMVLGTDRVHNKNFDVIYNVN